MCRAPTHASESTFIRSMSISDADKQDALDGYVDYSRVLDLDDLKEFYRDLDCAALINVRHVLTDAD
mgnify:CR=1 FL=1